MLDTYKKSLLLWKNIPIGKYLRVALITMLLPAPAFAEDPYETLNLRLTNIEAALVAVQNDVTAIKTRQAAIATTMSKLATGVSALNTRLASLERNGGGNIPIYQTASELPTDGSVLVALFQPEGGIYVLDFDGVKLLADQWLMVFDGVTPVALRPGLEAANGSPHEFPKGWFPAASGASAIEGIYPLGALSSLQDTLDSFLRNKGVVAPYEYPSYASIGGQMYYISKLLNHFYTELIMITPP